MDAVKNRDDLLSIKEEYLRRQSSPTGVRCWCAAEQGAYPLTAGK